MGQEESGRSQLDLFGAGAAARTNEGGSPGGNGNGSGGMAKSRAPAGRTRRRGGPKTAEEMGAQQREISVAEFFTKNRHLLGFDNATKALLTTVKEAVDNSLDACEEAGILPDIVVDISPATNGNGNGDGNGKSDPNAPERFRVAVEDNGPGVVKAQIPKIFGKLLYGSKFHRLRQSLTADQPVLVRRAGRVEWLPIGELVDGFLREGEDVADVTACDLEVPAFDHEEWRYRWRTVSHVIRHPRANEVLEVGTEGNRRVRVTGCHSLFGFEPQTGRVHEVEARDLAVGDYVVAPKKLPASRSLDHVNLLESLPTEALRARQLFVYGVPAEVLDGILQTAEVVHRRSASGRSRRHYRLTAVDGETIDLLDDSYRQYREKGFLPAWLVRALRLERACRDASLRTYHHGRPTETPVCWPLSPEVMRLLGLYVAEGHADRRQIGFTFSLEEVELHREVAATAEKLGLSVSVEPRESSVRLKVFGGASDLLLREWCGEGARQKHVPFFVFSAPAEMRQHFLDGLYEGDGHRVRGRDALMLTTTSRRLLDEVDTLWLMQGVVALRNGPFSHRGLGREPSTVYRLDIHGPDLDRSHVFRARSRRRSENRYRMLPGALLSRAGPGAGARVPARTGDLLRAMGIGTGPAGPAKSEALLEGIESGGIYTLSAMQALCDDRVTRHIPNHLARLGLLEPLEDRWIATDEWERLRQEIANVERLGNSDLCLLRVTSLETVEEPGEFVYDLSVPGCENFVAGDGGLACHNSRGQQGIGISAAGMYGQLTTGQPIGIVSRTAKGKPAHRFEILINTSKNQPEIVTDEVIEWEPAHGTRVEITLEARFQRGSHSVDEYLRECAVSNPHAKFVYRAPDGVETVFERGTDLLPESPGEIKPHPYGVELGILMQMLKSTSAKKLKAFLTHDFSRVSDAVASEICHVAGISQNAWVTRIAREEADALYQAIPKVKIRNPPTNCLAPIGKDAIKAGLEKEFEAEYVVSVTRSPTVYRGNPFLVEAGIAYGGRLPAEEPVKVIRFANRVPLLYQQSACAVTKAVGTTSWRNYGITHPKGGMPIGPLVVFVHFASVWVPFTSESKEAVAHYPEILKELRLALQECGRLVGRHIRRMKREKEAEKKRSYIEMYLPHISIALQEILDLTDEERNEADAKLVEILNRSRKA